MSSRKQHIYSATFLPNDHLIKELPVLSTGFVVLIPEMLICQARFRVCGYMFH